MIYKKPNKLSKMLYRENEVRRLADGYFDVNAKNLTPTISKPPKYVAVLHGEEDDMLIHVAVDPENPSKLLIVSGYDYIFSRYLKGGSKIFNAKLVDLSPSALEQILEYKRKAERSGVKTIRSLVNKIKK